MCRLEFFRSSALLLIALPLLACGDDGPTSTPPPPPTDEVVALELDPDTVALRVGETVRLTAYLVRESNARTEASDVVWQSFNTQVATVDSDGLVEAVGNGLTRISAEAENFTAQTLLRSWQTGTWFQVAPLPTPIRAGHAAVLNGKIYYIGGNVGIDTPVGSTHIYDQWSDSWSAGPAMPTARNWGAVAVLPDRIHIVGGVNANEPFSVDSRLFVNEAFIPGQNTWQTYAPMNFARGGAPADTVDGRFYVIGGSRGPLALDSVEVYDPSADSWASVPSLPAPLLVPSVGSIGGKLYVAGGEGRPCCPSLADLLIFDPDAGTWTPGPPMSTARAYAASVVVDGKLVVIGGRSSFGDILSEVEVFDPIAGAWSASMSIPVRLRDASAVVLDGVIYLLGGQTVSGNTNQVQAFAW